MVDKSETYSRVYGKILNFLSFRYRSCDEISKKIDLYVSKERISPDLKREIKDELLEVLESDGYIDDIKFTQAYIDSLSSEKKLKSKYSIKNTLLKKNIDVDIIDKLLSNIEEDYEIKAVKSAALKKLKSLNKENKYSSYEKKGRLIKYLLSKGFSSSLVYSVVDSFIDLE